MTEYTLPNDVCRCHDKGCPKHETCLRWLARNSGTGEWVSHSGSLYPYDRSLDQECPMYVEEKV